MDKESLLEGYKKILKGIYAPEPYYLRMLTFLKEYDQNNQLIPQEKTKVFSIRNLLRTVVFLGILDEGRVYYWRLFLWSLLRKPRFLGLAINLWVYGYHFRKIFRI